MVLDMHGHSRKKNIFIFGNTSESSYSRGPVTERTFPFLLSRISPVFSFQDCSFRVQKVTFTLPYFVLIADFRKRRRSQPHGLFTGRN